MQTAAQCPVNESVDCSKFAATLFMAREREGEKRERDRGGEKRERGGRRVLVIS